MSACELADVKPKRRFAEISEKQLQTIVENKDAVNTKRSTNQAVKIFREYLAEKAQSNDSESFSPSELDTFLGKFYAEARNRNGELYKKSSLTTMRFGLSRHIINALDIDIMKDLRFKNSNTIFKAVSKDLKRQGLGSVDHYPPIEVVDLQKSYFNLDLYSAKSLQRKVFMDIMVYFGRRGRENLRELKITDLAPTTDADGLRYIYYDETCPVRTFCRYKSKLNKNSAFLFQRPKSNTVGDCWYDYVPVGHNTLGNMMQNISKDCQLSKIYTNHSLRATTVHLLDVARFPDRHIMSVTGHKVESSLKTYTGYIDIKTKQKMSNTLSSVLRSSDNNVQKVDTCKTEKSCEQYSSLHPACFDLLPLSDSQEDQLIFDMKMDTNFDDIVKILNIPECQSVNHSFSHFGGLPMINNYGTYKH